MTDPRGREQKTIRHSTPVALFPSFVWLAELEDDVRERIHRGAMEWLDDMNDAFRDLARGGVWQSEPTIHEHGHFAELVTVIDRMTTSVLEFLRVAHEGVVFTGCWANITAPGAQQMVNHYPNNYLSGFYCLRAGAGSNTIQFHDPRPQVRIIRPPVRELTGENADMAVVRVDPGTMLLFPSWLEHSLPPNQGLEPRISVGFNLMFARYVETMGGPALPAARR